MTGWDVTSKTQVMLSSELHKGIYNERLVSPLVPGKDRMTISSKTLPQNAKVHGNMQFN
jgi:hypothetical protein